MSHARTVMRLMHILNMNEDEYATMQSHYNTSSPLAEDMSFEEYLEREIEAGRLVRRRTEISGRGGSAGARESGHRAREATGRSGQDRVVNPPSFSRESGHRSQEVIGRSNNDRALLSRPGPRESGHRSLEAGRSDNDQSLVSRPRPREDYMHHATSPSHASGARRGTGRCECEDSPNDDDSFDDDSSSSDTLAGSPGTDTGRFSGDRTLRGHETDRSRGTGSRRSTSSTDVDDFEDDDYDDHPLAGRHEATRPTTRRVPISRPQRRAQSPPPRRVQSPPPTLRDDSYQPGDTLLPRRLQFPPPDRPEYFFPRGDTTPPPSPLALGSPAQSLTSTHSSHAYSADGRSGAGYDAPPRGTRRGPLTANGTHFGETYYDPRGGPPPGNRRGGCLRDY